MYKRLAIFSIAIMLLTGCWDERQLKRHSLIMAIGYDIKENDSFQKTVAFPLNASDAQQNASTKSEVVSIVGETVKDTDRKLEQLLPQKFDRSKSRIIFLGEDLATNGVFPTLDSVYRDLRGPLNALVAVVNGAAKDALNINKDYSFLLSEFYFELLKSAEDGGLITNENVQSICPIILSDGKDIVLPYIGFNRDNSVAKIEGLALFSGDKMTGQLNIEESTMFLVLTNQFKKEVRFNFKVNDSEEHAKNFVDFVVRKEKRKLEIFTENEEVTAKINIELRIEIDEYAADLLDNEKKVQQLEQSIEEHLSKLADTTIAKMQEANSDTLGIGEKLKAYHHATWENINWEDIYKDIPIETKFNVKIVRHGIIN